MATGLVRPTSVLGTNFAIQPVVSEMAESAAAATLGEAIQSFIADPTQGLVAGQRPLEDSPAALFASVGANAYTTKKLRAGNGLTKLMADAKGSVAEIEKAAGGFLHRATKVLEKIQDLSLADRIDVLKNACGTADRIITECAPKMPAMNREHGRQVEEVISLHEQLIFYLGSSVLSGNENARSVLNNERKGFAALMSRLVEKGGIYERWNEMGSSFADKAFRGMISEGLIPLGEYRAAREAAERALETVKPNFLTALSYKVIIVRSALLEGISGYESLMDACLKEVKALKSSSKKTGEEYEVLADADLMLAKAGIIDDPRRFREDTLNAAARAHLNEDEFATRNPLYTYLKYALESEGDPEAHMYTLMTFAEVTMMWTFNSDIIGALLDNVIKAADVGLPFNDPSKKLSKDEKELIRRVLSLINYNVSKAGRDEAAAAAVTAKYAAIKKRYEARNRKSPSGRG